MLDDREPLFWYDGAAIEDDCICANIALIDQSTLAGAAASLFPAG